MNRVLVTLFILAIGYAAGGFTPPAQSQSSEIRQVVSELSGIRRVLERMERQIGRDQCN